MTYQEPTSCEIFGMEFMASLDQCNEVYLRVTRTPEWLEFRSLQALLDTSIMVSSSQMLEALEVRAARSAELLVALIEITQRQIDLTLDR